MSPAGSCRTHILSCYGENDNTMAMGKLLHLPEMTGQVPEGQEMDRRISTQWPERGSRSEELL